MPTGVRINYKALRQINPAAARKAVLEYLASCGHNVAATACAFGIIRSVVYAITRKQRAVTSRTAPRPPTGGPGRRLPSSRSA